MWEVATTPYNKIDSDPSTEEIEPVKDSNSTPAGDILSGAGGVAANPANIEAWLKIAAGISTIVLGGSAIGVYTVKRKRKKKAK
jgi:hypothetical protein